MPVRKSPRPLGPSLCASRTAHPPALPCLAGLLRTSPSGRVAPSACGSQTSSERTVSPSSESRTFSSCAASGDSGAACGRRRRCAEVGNSSRTRGEGLRKTLTSSCRCQEEEKPPPRSHPPTCLRPAGGGAWLTSAPVPPAPRELGKRRPSRAPRCAGSLARSAQLSASSRLRCSSLTLNRAPRPPPPPRWSPSGAFPPRTLLPCCRCWTRACGADPPSRWPLCTHRGCCAPAARLVWE